MTFAELIEMCRSFDGYRTDTNQFLKDGKWIDRQEAYDWWNSNRPFNQETLP